MGEGGMRGVTRLTLHWQAPISAEEGRGPPSYAVSQGRWQSVSPLPPPPFRAGVLRIVSALPFLPASAAVRTMLLSDISAGRLLLQAPSPPVAAATAQVRTERGGGEPRGGAVAAAVGGEPRGGAVAAAVGPPLPLLLPQPSPGPSSRSRRGLRRGGGEGMPAASWGGGGEPYTGITGWRGRGGAECHCRRQEDGRGGRGLWEGALPHTPMAHGGSVPLAVHRPPDCLG